MRYPVEDLAAHLGLVLGVVGGQQPGGPAEGVAAVAEAIGASSSTVKRARAAGGFTEAQAERYAHALGQHPAWIWGRRWWDAVDLPEGLTPTWPWGLRPVHRRGRLVLEVVPGLTQVGHGPADHSHGQHHEQVRGDRDDGAGRRLVLAGVA